MKALDGEPQDTNSAPKQKYMILQKVGTFNYPATLYTVLRSRDYYNCIWKLHVRIAAPAMVYQQETVQVHECTMMAATGMFLDPLSGVKHQLNTIIEVNNFATTVVGSLTYEGGHSHCEGMQTSLNGRMMVSLFVTENLEVTV